MPTMPSKSAFEPKNPRIINTYDDDDDEDELDDWSLTASSDATPRPRRRKTGTQALVEFLNTTSPEEFQKRTPKRASNFFFSRRTKTNKVPSQPPTSYPPNTVLRNNHIEIVARPVLRTSTSSSTRSRAPSMASKNSIRPTSNIDNPLLPSNRSSKRDSSLYSGSLRQSASIRSHMSQRMQRPDLDPSGRPIHTGTRISQIQQLASSEATLAPLMKSLGDMDTVEAGLRHRLERFKIVNVDPPKDLVASVLAEEHIRALQPPIESAKINVRHMQVQTIMLPPDEVTKALTVTATTSTSTLQESDEQDSGRQADGTKAKPEVEQLERELQEERLVRQRLEASFEEAFDHFEVLSGLAYKKLRELWEEKARWENAYMELHERWLMDTNGQAVRYNDDFPNSEYCLAEEDEEEDLAQDTRHTS